MELIPITERLPKINQDVIAYNGVKLVAAKYTSRRTAKSIDPLVIETEGVFDVEKYTSEGDRSMSSTWVGVTHWMPAYIDEPK